MDIGIEWRSAETERSLSRIESFVGQGKHGATKRLEKKKKKEDSCVFQDIIHVHERKIGKRSLLFFFFFSFFFLDKRVNRYSQQSIVTNGNRSSCHLT